MDNPKPVVLVVEDEDSLRGLIQSLVEDFCGVTTIPASNGIDALRLAHEAMPSLILLDIMLPGLDGLEVARVVKNRPDTRHIPIVAVTASVSLQKVVDAGIDDCIPKPFDLDFFLTKVQKHLLSAAHAGSF